MDITILIPAIRLTDCTVTVRPQDVAGATGLPPKTLLEGGKLNIINKRYLSALQTAKRTFSSEAARFGFLFHGLHIVPREREDEAMASIQERVIERGEQAKAELAAVYEDAVERQILEFPEWETLLRGKAPSLTELMAKISFAVIPVPFTASASQFGQEAFNKLAKEIVPALERDVASLAKGILEGPIGASGPVLVSSLNPVRELAWKLSGFRLIDPRIGPVASALEDALAGCPSTGHVPVSDQILVASLLKQMANPQTLWSITKAAGAAQQQSLPIPPTPAPTPVMQAKPVVAPVAPSNPVVRRSVAASF